MIKKFTPRDIDKIVLDEYELEIENSLGNITISKDSQQLKASLKKAAEEYFSNKKQINIRVSPQDLAAIKLQASKKGLPYQSYINMLLHQTATGQVHVSN
jgi:predicted DNA binding CopG/RHH family protein